MNTVMNNSSRHATGNAVFAMLSFAMLSLWLVPIFAWAQTTPAGQPTTPPNNIGSSATTSLGKFATDAGYSTSAATTPTSIVGNIIGYALALLGVVFTILTIYAGFLWMTAQGNEEQISKAKKMLTNAVIGMIIIGAAYAISSFVINTLTTSMK